MRIGARSLQSAVMAAGILVAGAVISPSHAQSNYVTTRCSGDVCQRLVCDTNGACAVVGTYTQPPPAAQFAPLPAYNTLFPKPGEPALICDFYGEHCHH